MRLKLAPLGLLLWSSLSLSVLAQVRGHSHNDYAQSQPFWTAARAGMVSLEVDLFWTRGGLLRVGHHRAELESERDLDRLYWEPLRAWEGPPLELLVDIKSDPDKIVPLLRQRLLERPRGLGLIVLSGARPSQRVEEEFMTQEGSLEELLEQRLAPGTRFVSGRWGSYFDWDGQGEMPSAQRQSLEALVAQAHRCGVKLRLWGAPDGEACWRVQKAAGVDRINTDRPQQLGVWLQESP